MIAKIVHITRNMGMRYVLFRSWYEFKKRTGILKKSFPDHVPSGFFIKLEQWRKEAKPFFFESEMTVGKFQLSNAGREKVKKDALLILEGKLTYFSSKTYEKDNSQDWLVNPETGYRYMVQHWTEIPDFDPERGDIKYVWEKSRFSFLYPLIRYQQHFQEDQANFIFNKIEDWIAHNPMNMGPNYVCSQEISLRCMNWIFALYYFKNHPELTQDRFQRIMNSIYGQVVHVEKNINFSRIAVRNNHAITETLFLYLSGLLFPELPGAERRKIKGKKYFEEEVLYQVADDGSFIQYSMNYHRVVIQLFSWALFLCRANNEAFSGPVQDRIRLSVDFLYQCQDDHTGYLPNYGNNDGALFFPLNSTEFRNYKGQINALNYYFTGGSIYPNGDWQEDVFWYTGKSGVPKKDQLRTSNEFHSGGYYVMRESDKFSFIRCGNHPNRPAHADNLHLDIWFEGKNLLRDAGSYKYNATEQEMNFFFGSASHNVVMVNGSSQMKKGPRFIWYNWSQAIFGKTEVEGNAQHFEGGIRAFSHISNSIEHRRKVSQHSVDPVWEIEDKLLGTNLPCQQIWNLSPDFYKMGFTISACDSKGKKLLPIKKKGWYSSHYGQKEESEQIIFESTDQYFKTVIHRKEKD